MLTHEVQSERLRKSFLGRVEDPTLVANLTSSRPDADQDPIVVGRYDVTPRGGLKENPSGPWTWCSHCQKLNHWVGYVIQSNGGERHLIGGDCGKQHYGSDRFSTAKNDFSKEEKRVSQVRTLRLAANRKFEIEREINDYRLSQAYMNIIETRKQLRSVLAGKFQTLVNAVTRGELNIQERVVTDRGEVNYQSVNLGAISGQGLIKSDLSFYEKNLLEVLRGLAEQEIEYLDSGKRSKLVREIREHARAIVACNQKLQQSASFFVDSNIVRLNRWLNTAGMSISVKSDGSHAQIRKDNSLIAEVKVLENVSLPDMVHTTALLTA